MAVQNYTAPKLYPYVEFKGSPEDISVLLLGEDISDQFGCVVDFKVDERLLNFASAVIIKKDDSTYRIYGYSDDTVNVGDITIPSDLGKTVALIVGQCLGKSWKFVH